MTSSCVAITGAYGYLGSRIRARLDAAGWRTVALVREPRANDRAAHPWVLGRPLPDLDEPAGVLVHCAYDMTLRDWSGIERVNIGGTRELLSSAAARDIERILVLSSMSAYDGTQQLYGRAKLQIEALTLGVGGIAVRPGLVYGPGAHGMVGTLRKLVRLPVTPVIAGAARQYPVLESDFVRAIQEILESESWTPEIFGIAQPSPVTFRSVLSYLARQDGRSCRMIPVPWQAAYLAIKIIERIKPSVELRSDSLLGLVRPAPNVPHSTAFPNLLDDLTVMA